MINKIRLKAFKAISKIIIKNSNQTISLPRNKIVRYVHIILKKF